MLNVIHELIPCLWPRLKTFFLQKTKGLAKKAVSKRIAEHQKVVHTLGHK